MKRRLSEGVGLQSAVAASLVAAILVSVWFYVGPDEFNVSNSVGFAMLLLVGFILVSAAAIALACWLSYGARLVQNWREQRIAEATASGGSVPGNLVSAHSGNGVLRFAKFSSLVAAIMVAIPALILLVYALFPPHCGDTTDECGLGEVYLWFFSASIAAIGVIIAGTAWIVYSVNRYSQRREDGKGGPRKPITGLWTLVLAFDAVVLFAAALVTGSRWLVVFIAELGVIAGLLIGGVYLIRKWLARRQARLQSG
jgi:hypothetical protein